jgi:hypothetical protein
MVLLSGFIGLYIKNKIWGLSNKPKNAIEYGRAWAAYLAFITPLSSIHFYTKKDFFLASIEFLISLIIFPLIAFLIGCIFGFIKSRVSNDSEVNTSMVSGTIFGSAEQKLNHSPINDSYYEQALNELNTNNMKASVWAKAIADSGGDNGKEKSRYIQYRVSELINENIQHKDISPVKNSFRRNSIFVLITSIIIVSVLTGLYLRNDKSDNWLEISSFPNLSFGSNGVAGTTGAVTYYIDTNSISMDKGFYYAFYGISGGPNKEIGFTKLKGEFDCQGDSGFRIIEEYRYSSSLQFGLKEPYFTELDYQKNIHIPRGKDLNPNYSYDGGWQTLSSLKRAISFFSDNEKEDKLSLNFIINTSRAEISLINYVCTKSMRK